MSEETDSDSTRQNEEIEALSAIYGDDFLMVDSTEKLFDVRVRHEKDQWWSLTLQVLLPRSYPTCGPPVFEIHGTWLNECDQFEIGDKLYRIFLENMNELVVFQWVEALREFMNEKSSLYADIEQLNREPANTDSQLSLSTLDETVFQGKANEKDSIPWQTDDDITEILHGEPITDRKSTFQAHLTQVKSEKDVQDALNTLKKTRKIANATHNIFAYRITKEDSNVLIQDCNDDGEHHAGSRLLHLLQILQVQNYLIVVSRWYGGILLGPDRFKHINNCARNLLKAANVIQDNRGKHEPHHKENKLKMRKLKYKH